MEHRYEKLIITIGKYIKVYMVEPCLMVNRTYIIAKK